MKKKEKQMTKLFIFKAFLLVNALFLFHFNVNEALAEELNNHFIEQEQTEMTTEPSEDEKTGETEVIDGVQADIPIEDENLLEEAVIDIPAKQDAEDGVQNTDDQTEEESTTDENIDEEFQFDENAPESLNDLVEDDQPVDEEELYDEEDMDTLSKENQKEEPSEADEQDEELTDSVAGQEKDTVAEVKSSNALVDTPEEDSNSDNNSKEPLSVMATFQALKATLEDSDNSATVDRIDGPNRFSNAVAMSQSGWDRSEIVYLVNGHKFADMLSGAPLASLHNAPILLTRENNVPNSTLAEIKRLNAGKVIVLGGEPSVHNSVLTTLEAHGLKASRIGGINRYHQAELVANEVMQEMAHEEKKREAFLISGQIFSDGMSIAPVAASKRLPIFLTRENLLEQAVINNIPYVSSWILVGGYPTISLEVEQQMNALGAITHRIDGKNRYEVNRNVLNHYGTHGDHLYVASGEHYSDGIPAAVLAARKGNGLLLVKNDSEPVVTEQKNFAHKERNIRKFTFVGSTATLSAQTADIFRNVTDYLIYLDPGHGGWEPGAVGYVDGQEIIEKDLNLEVSFKLRDLLEAQGYEVVMSRTDDSFVSLNDRPAEANQLGADIFVSIHHNAMPRSSTTTGIETYFYKPSSSYPPLAQNQPYHNDPQRLADSEELAELIQNELINHTGAVDRGVKSLSFAVLREAHMPAVLLELGYMSTPTDLRVFSQNWYQDNMSQAVADGINRYFA